MIRVSERAGLPPEIRFESWGIRPSAIVGIGFESGRTPEHRGTAPHRRVKLDGIEEDRLAGEHNWQASKLLIYTDY